MWISFAPLALALVTAGCSRPSESTSTSPDPGSAVASIDTPAADGVSPTASAEPSADVVPNQSDHRPMAVVELFTSEGCSSCPPADRVLQKLAHSAKESDRRIYTLAFHVDYWNYLGHEDRFSDPDYSARQRWYASHVFDGRVYTPQLIVGGRTELVGSHERKVLARVEAVLTERPAVSVSLAARRKERDPATWLVDYSVAPVFDDTRVQLALVQSDAETLVTAGENTGRRLEHASVVREFVSASARSERGRWRVQVPDDVGTADMAVVAFVQRSDTGKILGANAVPLSTSE